MDAAFKAKWIAALRSGEFKQARGTVGDVDTKYLCCLGVGAHVASPSANLFHTHEAVNELAKQGLSHPVDADGNFTHEVCVLIEMNDEHRNSFAEIADYIEANL